MSSGSRLGYTAPQLPEPSHGAAQLESEQALLSRDQVVWLEKSYREEEQEEEEGQEEERKDQTQDEVATLFNHT